MAEWMNEWSTLDNQLDFSKTLQLQQILLAHFRAPFSTWNCIAVELNSWVMTDMTVKSVTLMAHAYHRPKYNLNNLTKFKLLLKVLRLDLHVLHFRTDVRTFYARHFDKTHFHKGIIHVLSFLSVAITRACFKKNSWLHISTEKFPSRFLRPKIPWKFSFHLSKILMTFSVIDHKL